MTATTFLGIKNSLRELNLEGEQMKIDPDSVLVKQHHDRWGEAILHLGAHLLMSSEMNFTSSTFLLPG